MKNTLVALILALGVVAPTSAQVAVEEPWARATVPQQRATGVFMKLTSPRDVRLVGVASPAANVVELHEMKMEGEVMKMRAVDGLDLPAGEVVELKSGAHHLMLIDLKEQVRDGDMIPVTLTFEDAEGKRETVEVTAPARPLTHQHGHGHRH